jgi:hypothetical protein
VQTESLSVAYTLASSTLIILFSEMVEILAIIFGIFKNIPFVKIEKLKL